MKNKLTIEQQFVVDGRIFQSKEDAQKYIEIVEEERTKNEYNNTVYYENWTTYGTGWIEKVTIETENNQVFVESECVYTRMYSKQ